MFVTGIEKCVEKCKNMAATRNSLSNYIVLKGPKYKRYIHLCITVCCHKEWVPQKHCSIQGVTEKCGHTLGTSSAYQNMGTCPYRHVSGNI
jgi:hypothetical protein